MPRFLRLAFRPGIVKRSFFVAVIVGSILNLINQGEAILGTSDASIVWWKCILTFMVPYCVSTYGAVTALMKYEPDDD
ncbi:MAG: nitrate/nitrite transporter NrtS [Pseudomonadota bacterium]